MERTARHRRDSVFSLGKITTVILTSRQRGLGCRVRTALPIESQKT